MTSRQLRSIDRNFHHSEIYLVQVAAVIRNFIVCPTVREYDIALSNKNREFSHVIYIWRGNSDVHIN